MRVVFLIFSKFKWYLSSKKLEAALDFLLTSYSSRILINKILEILYLFSDKSILHFYSQTSNFIEVSKLLDHSLIYHLYLCIKYEMVWLIFLDIQKRLSYYF